MAAFSLDLLAAFSLDLLAAAFAGFIGCFRWTVTDGVRCSEQTEIPDRSSYHSFTLRLVLEESIKEATSGGRRSAPAIKDVAEYCDSLMVNFLQEEEIEEQVED